MGGFRVTSGRDSYSVPVNAQQLLYLIKYGYVAFPTVSQEDLIAMSSGDLFSKYETIHSPPHVILANVTPGSLSSGKLSGLLLPQ